MDNVSIEIVFEVDILIYYVNSIILKGRVLMPECLMV